MASSKPEVISLPYLAGMARRTFLQLGGGLLALGPMSLARGLETNPVDTSSIVDLRNARVSASTGLTSREKKALEMLIQEVEARTGLTWTASSEVSSGPVITLHHASGRGPAEGFRLSVRGGGVEIQGNDELGTLFGVGRFLRELRWSRGQVQIPDGINIVSSLKYPLRGHQIGYRPSNNTYDAWTPAIFEQYVRDMAVFGTNAVELIPPRSGDFGPVPTNPADAAAIVDSPHFHLPRMEMMVETSRILDEYGLQVWIWYPALESDYSDPKTVETSLQEWGDVFHKLPRIDAVFVPGGDPGKPEPKFLMALLEKQTRVLHQHHPKAQMWVSPQTFDTTWLNEFLAIVKTEPAWLTGIVYGPWTRITLDELRAQVPARYPIRYYPDITHTIHCEFPVPHWDVAYAVTEARETINPRPVDYQKIFQVMSPPTIGFITYSDGANDDVNKFVWSGLGWNPDADLTQILREYSRYFISPHWEDGFTQGILNLERNWRGPLLSNALVDGTLLEFQDMERAASPQMLLNWRFQQALYRAYFDGLVRQRLIYETALEQQALERLREAPRAGSLVAMAEAEQILTAAVRKPVADDLRSRLFALGEALFQSIHMQLSVDRYAAMAVTRGANLDTVDFPLNNRIWLGMQFAKLRMIDKEEERLAGLAAIVHRTDPGPGGFYDVLGSAGPQPHLVNEGPGFDKDPGGYRSIRTDYAVLSSGVIRRTSLDANNPQGPAKFLQTPTSWWSWAETRYETPFTMRYTQLDPGGRYKLRVVFAAQPSSHQPPAARLRLVANDTLEVHPWFKRPFPMQPMEFDIPSAALHADTLTLRWESEPGGGGFNSGIAIAEAFLIREHD